MSIDCATPREVLDFLLRKHAKLRAGPRRLSPWLPIATAPKGGGAERTDDPKWVEPPELLMAFEDGTIEICYWDWYYAPGGNGYTEGVSAWIGASGEQVARFQGDPIAWMPLPPPPNTKSSDAPRSL